MIYTDFARYYDLVYSWKEYEKEALILKSLILHFKRSKGKELLDVACGTGKHLKYLKRWFSCTGVDINEGMLKVARKNVKGVVFKKADMVNFNLDKKFDVITCLFSSIGHAKTYANLRKTIRNFAKHLKTGGVLIFESWLTKTNFKKGLRFMTTYDGKDIKIARLNVPKAVGNLSILEFHYLVAEKNKGIRYFVDRHELGLFDVRKTLDIMRKAGLEARFLNLQNMERHGLKGYDLKKLPKGVTIKDRGIYAGIKT